MARKPKQKQQTEAPKSFDDSSAFDADDDDNGDDAGIIEPDVPDVAPQTKLRDWRDVERYKEMRMLRKLVADDLDPDLD